MPRRFTEEEEQRIRTALMAAGRKIMGLRGVRKTSIDELVNSAGIAKGSFYRFFPSKEALALAVLAEWEREFHQSINNRFAAKRPKGHAQTAGVLQAVFLEDFPQAVMASGLSGLMEAQELAHLAQRSDAQHRNLMDQQDLRLFERLEPHFTAAGLTPGAQDEAIIAGLRLLFEAALSTVAAAEDGPLRPAHYRQAFGHLLGGFLRMVFLPTQTNHHTGVSDE